MRLLIKTIKSKALQFAAIWWLPSLVRPARHAVMALGPTAPRPQIKPRQLLVDVSIISTNDAGTGIQRVVRSLLLQLLKAPPAGFEVRPIRATRKLPFVYANRYLATLTSSRSSDEDKKVEVSPGDIFLGLDLTSRIVPRRQFELLNWRAKGVRCAFVVYDLLPLSHQQWFTPRAARSFRHWMSTLAIHADALFCISRTVSEQVCYSMTNRFGLHENHPDTNWFHLGADLPHQCIDTKAKKSDPLKVRSAVNGQSILMVGTIEPRKGHAQILDAFELLWEKGREDKLIIAGRPGWRAEPLIERLTNHPEAGKRLQWLPDATDSQLAQFYEELDGLIMASEAEGFGLPLIEAAQHGLPIFARDLPVFREVAGNHAAYFIANDRRELAPQLEQWLSELRAGRAPSSRAIQPLTWSGSAEQLKNLLAAVDNAT